MKTIKQLTTGALLVIFLFTGCVDDIMVKGNGILRSEERITPNFSKVSSSGSFIVHITRGDEFDILVSAEENILPYIKTRVYGSDLHIDTRGFHSISNTLPMEVYITMPELRGVVLSGSGEITTDYFYPDHFNALVSGSGNISTAIEAKDIEAMLSGSGSLDLSGIAEEASLIVSGSGQIDAYHLDIEKCDAKISGSGDMWINASDFITASISGSGNVYYYGDPAVETHISGSGNVIHKNR